MGARLLVLANFCNCLSNAGARKNKHADRMLADAREDHSVPRDDKKSILNRWFQKTIEKVKKNTIKKIESSVIFTQINDKMWTTLKST